ncbi:MAG TPA: peptidase M16 [Brevundimonas sp.]|nr:peptidase M16 [Brevundimonas sp.]
MPGLRTIAVTVAVNGGARMEDEARSGWSHLLEHLVFKGAGDMGAREIVERIEAEGGSINAATGYERTSFDIRALKGSLPLAMQVLSDLVFRPTLAPEEIEREKDVVAQEIAEAFDTPDDHVFEMAQTRAFVGQALGRPILGSIASLAPVEREMIGDWRRRLYSPDRMVVAVSGGVDEDELLPLAETWFGHQAATPTEALPAAVFVGGEARLARKIEQANLVFQLPTLGARDERLPALRPASAAFDGQEPILTFDEVIVIARDASARAGRVIGVAPELKHPSHFAALGLPMEDVFIAALERHGLTGAHAPILIQCFEVGTLERLAARIDSPLLQLMQAHGGPADRPGATYAEMATPHGLAAIARYAGYIGVQDLMVVPRDDAGRALEASALTDDAHAAGLKVVVWTFRAENVFLPAQYRVGDVSAAHGDFEGWLKAIYALGVDAVFSDFPAAAVNVR